MDELQGLIELLQLQSGSSVIDLRYRPDEDEPPWAVIIDWGDKYTAVVPGSIQENPIASLRGCLRSRKALIGYSLSIDKPTGNESNETILPYRFER
jgi:hypothetical protein